MTRLALVSFELWRAGRLLAAGRIREARLVMARISAAMDRIEAV